MQKIFVDTSGWVALFVKNDSYHKKALDIFEGLKVSKSIMFTSDYVIDETITTILVRGDHKQSVIAGQSLLTSKIIKLVCVNTDYFQDAWELYQKYRDKKFSFTDVTSIVIMKELNINKAFSFDREFVQAGIELIE